MSHGASHRSSRPSFPKGWRISADAFDGVDEMAMLHVRYRFVALQSGVL